MEFGFENCVGTLSSQGHRNYSSGALLFQSKAESLSAEGKR